MTPYHVTDPSQGPAILDLLQAAFAGMHARIDPPSSLHGMTVDTLFASGEVWVIGTPPVACVVLSTRDDALYLGKLAVAKDQRGTGLARAMIIQAARRADALGLHKLMLQTRVELVENHATFRALGFVETGRTAHPGYSRATTITLQRPITGLV